MAASTTTLMIGDSVSAEVALYKAVGDKAAGVKFERRYDDEPNLDSLFAAAAAQSEALPGREEYAAEAEKIAASALGAAGDEAEASLPEPDLRYGVTVGDRFVDVTDELAEIDEAVQIEGLVVEAFVDARSVPRERVVGAYFVGARDRGAPKVLRLLRDAMRSTGRVALVRWTKRTNQAVGVLSPHRSGALLLTELAFADVAREPDPSCVSPLEQATVSESEVQSAVYLVRAFSERPVAIEEVVDERTVLRARLRDLAEAGRLEEFEIPESEAWLDEDTAAAFREAAEVVS